MTNNVETLKDWIQICLIVAAICTTLFPLLYSFFPWYSTVLGRLLMLQGVAFALAIDLTLLFQFWQPNSIIVIFWLNAIVFTLIAASTFALTFMMMRTNRIKRVYQKEPRRRMTDV